MKDLTPYYVVHESVYFSAGSLHSVATCINLAQAEQLAKRLNTMHAALCIAKSFVEVISPVTSSHKTAEDRTSLAFAIDRALNQ